MEMIWKSFLNEASDHQNIINFLIFESLNQSLSFISSYFVIVGKSLKFMSIEDIMYVMYVMYTRNWFLWIYNK